MGLVCQGLDETEKSPTQTNDSQFQFSQFVKCNFFNLVVATPGAMVDTSLGSLIAHHNAKATNSQCQTSLQGGLPSASTSEAAFSVPQNFSLFPEISHESPVHDMLFVQNIDGRWHFFIPSILNFFKYIFVAYIH